MYESMCAFFPTVLQILPCSRAFGKGFTKKTVTAQFLNAVSC